MTIFDDLREKVTDNCSRRDNPSEEFMPNCNSELYCDECKEKIDLLNEAEQKIRDRIAELESQQLKPYLVIEECKCQKDFTCSRHQMIYLKIGAIAELQRLVAVSTKASPSRLEGEGDHSPKEKVTELKNCRMCGSDKLNKPKEGIQSCKMCKHNNESKGE